ncbi:RNA-binding protein [Halomicrobium katesii]|uniref:RNA-binding protein n=1 Tax=Halomicrobium katesii TaxID=437163 RepID=UPI0003792E32|nr:RNA-binding protein [Halomicrobium katesii]
MSSVPFHYVDLRAFAYATEDEKRVAEALQTYLPDETELERAESEGHYGDRIAVLSARVENADDIRHVLTQVAAVDDLETVLEELDDRVDDNCSFFLTFDKQAAFGNSVERGDGITLRAKVEAYPAKRETAIENAQDALSEL